VALATADTFVEACVVAPVAAAARTLASEDTRAIDSALPRIAVALSFTARTTVPIASLNSSTAFSICWPRASRALDSSETCELRLRL